MEDIFGSFQVVSNRQVLKYQWTGVSAAMLTDGATTMATPSTTSLAARKQGECFLTAPEGTRKRTSRWKAIRPKGKRLAARAGSAKPEPRPITSPGTGPRATSVNEIGPFGGSTAVSVPKDGIYRLQVQAKGLATLLILVAPCWVRDLEIASAEVEAVFGPISAAPPAWGRYAQFLQGT
jgi:1-acyl-sn-glycerol-3-phosphate acyltransferase